VSGFKGRHFEGEIVLWAVGWYCRYGISYRDLEQMMAERSVSVDHLTIYRWVQKYAPEIETRLRWQWRCPRSTSWRVDETDVKVGGKCPEETEHRQVKYLNTVVEADHGKLEQLIRPVRGFKSLKTAYTTIKGFEVMMRALRKGQTSSFRITRDMRGDARLVERAFNVGPGALAEAVQVITQQFERQDA